MQVIALRKAELGEGFQVARALPTRERRMVGAWCFLDHLGPVELGGGRGMHVAPHPHTCLQTFTWMMRGEILHRDSLGSEQVIRPGQVNLMTAGPGIAHTEDSLQDGTVLHAAQLWIALPDSHAAVEPAFDHYPELPQWQHKGVELSLLVGEFAGYVAPTRVYTPLVALDLHAPQGGLVSLPLRRDFEYGLLPTVGSVIPRFVRNAPAEGTATETGEGVVLDAHRFAYLAPGVTSLQLELAPGSRCLLIGGEPFAESITMWWNFVAHSKGYIDAAYADWQNGSARFPDVPGATSARLPSPRPAWQTGPAA